MHCRRSIHSPGLSLLDVSSDLDSDCNHQKCLHILWNALEHREGLKLPSVENHLFGGFINKKKGIFGGFYEEKEQKGST